MQHKLDWGDGSDRPAAPSFDASFGALERVQLDARSWLDYQRGWVRGHAALFESLLASRKWSQRRRWMYERQVLEPRLTAPWSVDSPEPLPPIIESMRLALSQRYGVTFDSVGFNLYRDGQDSVAWHVDHISDEIPTPIVVLVSLGARRKLLLRPKGGGSSHAYWLGEGDLFVTGGRSQREWEHAVPKVAHVDGPRISLAFRYGLRAGAYER